MAVLKIWKLDEVYYLIDCLGTRATKKKKAVSGPLSCDQGPLLRQRVDIRLPPDRDIG